MTRSVCHIVDFGGRTGGSFMASMTALSQALLARGDRFTVVASQVAGAAWPDELRAAGARVALVRDEREAQRALREIRPDIVHSHFSRYDLAALRAWPSARVFWHVHTHRENASALAHAKAFAKYRLLAKRIEAVVTVSQAMRRECIEWYARAERVRVIHNGIDCDVFRPPSALERNAARETFGLKRQDRVALFFDRVPYKGGETVREALRASAAVRLLVTGGTQGDRERFAALTGAVVLERVADARQLYWASDALVFASDREAFGFVLAEALACGLPIAASDIPVVDELCGGVRGVFRFAPRDAAGLNHALQSALASARESQVRRSRALERFSLARWTAEILRMYD